MNTPKRKPSTETCKAALCAEISEKLGAGVKIKSGKKGAGQLIISFHSGAELDGILEYFSLQKG